MPKFKVHGTFAKTYYTGVDRIVEAKDADEALRPVQDECVASLEFNEDDVKCVWLHSGPHIYTGGGLEKEDDDGQ